MAKINKHILIVRSSVMTLSSMSLKSAMALQATLATHYYKVDIATVNCLDDMHNVVTAEPDVAFIGVHSIPILDGDTLKTSNTIWVTDYLIERGITCTGSPSSAHVLENNKALAKQKLIDSGLATANYFVTGKACNLPKEAAAMSYPMFVKPLSMGGGSGIDQHSVVNTFSQLNAKTKSIKDVLFSESLVEDYLTGREFSVAILKNIDTNEYFVMPLELIAPNDVNGNKLLSKSVKQEDTETFTAITDKVLKRKISELALSAFIALGARDYGRIDIRLNKLNIPQFLEANLIPSILEGYGNFPKACQINQGITYQQAMLRIVELALNRQTVKSNPKLEPVLNLDISTI